MKPAQKPPTCDGCPAQSYGVGWVAPEIPRHIQPTIAFVGQGPGETEALYSIPFHPEAASGKMLTEWIHLAGLQRTEVLITNLVWCWLPHHYERGVPKGSRNPEPEEADHCYRVHLYPLLERLGFGAPGKWVFTVGAPASEYLLELEGSSEPYLGTLTIKDLPRPK